MIKEIEKAIINDQVLEIIYISANGIITQRAIKPFYSDPTYFRAYCFLRKSIRTFKVDHVLACTPNTKKEFV